MSDFRHINPRRREVTIRSAPPPSESMTVAELAEKTPEYSVHTYDVQDIDDVIERVVMAIEKYENDHYAPVDRVIVGRETGEYLYAATEIDQPVGDSSVVRRDDEMRVFDVPITIVSTPMIEAVGEPIRDLHHHL